MFRPTPPGSDSPACPPELADSSGADGPRDPALDREPSAYGASFWFAYLANTLLMVAVSLLFRYGDFVHAVGGGELQLGLIVGAGAIGSLAMRLAQGAGIDRYGPRQIWLLSLAVVAVTLVAHLPIARADAPAVYLVRIAYHCSLAGAFGASITYISLRAPVARMAELVGMLGTSGFVGMTVGAQLGDLLCRAEPLTRWHIDRLFLVAAALVFGSLCSAWAATRGEIRPLPRRRPPLLWLVRRYHPGRMLAIGLAMGVGVGLPGTFLRPYAESLGIAGIGAYFTVYSLTAFAMRLATRHLPARIGIRRTVLWGMAAVAASMLLYLPVRSAWQLLLPALAAGVGHALLFPAVMAGGSVTFPERYRGLGVTLTLATFDLGNLVGMPLAGAIVHLAGRAGLPPWPTMFITVAALLVAASVYYATEGKGATVERTMTITRSAGEEPAHAEQPTDMRSAN